MLSVNDILNYLEDKQIRIDPIYYKKINNFEKNKNDKMPIPCKLDNFQSKLPKFLNIFFNKSISDFYYDYKLYNNKSSIFTLFNSIFLIGNEYFNINNSKEEYIKEFIKNMDNDIFQKDLYNKFNYVKNKHFNKSDIQMVLKDAYKFKSCDKFSLLKKYLSDYLGINLYIFSIENGCIIFEKSEFYVTSQYGDIKNKFTPNFILINENEIYKPILNNKHINNSSIILYSEYTELIDNIWNYFNIVNDEIKLDDIDENIIEEHNKKYNFVDLVKLKIDDIAENIIEEHNKKYNFADLVKLKIDDIKKLCIENNIELQKKSEKTMKLINKLKNDLINDLINI